MLSSEQTGSQSLHISGQDVCMCSCALSSEQTGSQNLHASGQDVRVLMHVTGLARAINAVNKEAILAFFGDFFLGFFLADVSGFGLYSFVGVSGKFSLAKI